jgi:hypothetical protein
MAVATVVLKALTLADSEMRDLVRSDAVPKVQCLRAQCLAVAAEVLETRVLRVPAMRPQAMEAMVISQKGWAVELGLRWVGTD